MILVLVEIRLREGALEQARAAIRTMEAATRQEAGCITYAFSSDVSDPQTLRVTERWESIEALSAHMKAPHMAAFGKAVVAIQPESMDVKAYEAGAEIQLPR